MRSPTTLTLALIGLLAGLPANSQELSTALSNLTVTVGKALMLDSPVKIKHVAASAAELIESSPSAPARCSSMAGRQYFPLPARYQPAAAIHALEAKRQLQVLAEPNLLVINNTQAHFVAGAEFPFPLAVPPDALPMEQLIRLPKPASKMETVTSSPKQ